VVFPRECGVTVKDDDKEFVVLKESNVLAIDY
jgi:co-chaperonin GroES (HSP10)